MVWLFSDQGKKTFFIESKFLSCSFTVGSFDFHTFFAVLKFPIFFLFKVHACCPKYLGV